MMRLALTIESYFLQEDSQPTSTPADALRHRRALIERWATASQEFREVRIATPPILMPFLNLLSFPPPPSLLNYLGMNRKNY